MEISFINDEYSSHLEDSLHFAQKNNLRYIELRNVNSRNICDFSLAEAADMAHKIQSSGILVSSIASPFLNWATDTTDFNICGQKVADEAAYFTQLMDLADIFGAPNINIYSYLKNDTISMEELGKKLDIYSQMALERGISLLLENDAKQLLISFAEKNQLSARAYHRTLRLARTIADLQNSEKIFKIHVAEALSYRRIRPLKRI